MSERELTYGEAVKEAIAEEMRRDPRVFLIGEDMAEAGHPFKTLVGLVQEFGTDRVIDTPISEPGYAGIGVGAAMTGMRPVVDVMFGDFITLTMDQMVNQAAKAHYMSGGKIKVPIVFRTTLGATRRSAAQHSQSLHAWVSHVPGLKVALPSGPYEAKGLMKTAIRDDSPVVIFEDKMMYRVKGPVPEGDYTIPFGVAEVKRAGKDITIVATSSMVRRGPRRRQAAGGRGHQRGGDRPAHHVAARQAGADRLGQEDLARAGGGRGLRALRRHRRDRLGDRGGRLLLPGRAGQAHGRHGRAGAVLAGARGPHGPVGADRLRGREGAVSPLIPLSPPGTTISTLSPPGRGQGEGRAYRCPTNVIMPALELAQETGKLLRWIKAPGDTVRKGEPIAEIETDKVTVELEAPASGVLRDVTAQEGDVVPVGHTIAIIADSASPNLSPQGAVPAPSPLRGAAPFPPSPLRERRRPRPSPLRGEGR